MIGYNAIYYNNENGGSNEGGNKIRAFKLEVGWRYGQKVKPALSENMLIMDSLERAEEKFSDFKKC